MLIVMLEVVCILECFRMTKLTYGQKSQINFTGLEEKYTFIGYLANHDVVLQWEHNEQQGAWGQEGRIAFNSDDVLQFFPNLGYTAGVGKYTARLNCNEFVHELFSLGFMRGNTQNIMIIRANIHANYHDYFDTGCSL